MDIISIIIFVAFWLIWSVTNSLIAYRRGNNEIGLFIASLLISPLLAYLYLLATPIPNDETRTKALLRALLEKVE